MPSRPRYCPAGYPVHVIQRGNDRQLCFAEESDLAAYASWLQEYADQYNVQVHGWVFMTNHVHLLLTPQTDAGISKLMQTLGRLYVRYFNHRYQRSGTLFEGRYRSSLVQQEEYLLACQRYIELNPVRAGLVHDPGDYRWSSYRAHAFGVEPAIWSPHELYNALGQDSAARQANYRALFKEALEMEVTAKIRLCTDKGLVLGTERFRERVKLLTGE
jgi:putative transposase